MPGSDDRVGQRTHPLSALFFAVSWAVAFVVAGNIGLSWISGQVDIGLLAYILVVPIFGLVGAGVGSLSWAFRRYVIDDDEIRVDSGILWRTSRRVPFERLQSVDITEPLLARIFGLAKLQIESAGGGESQTSLSYLKLPHAKELRTTLLNRANRAQGASTGEDGPVDDGGEPVGGDEPRRVITVVRAQRLLVATVLSLDFLLAVAGVVLSFILIPVFLEWWMIFTVTFPLGAWLVSIVVSRIIGNWDFTLSEGTRGLRIERGLLSRHSQTIPVDRVQGLRIEEPFVWRRFGWMRLRVDVAGYAAEASGDGSYTNTTLLPITDRAMADWIMNRLVPGAAETPEHSFRPATWWFAPIGWRFRSIGATTWIVRTTTGWIYRRTDVVPHAKVQSAATQHGPLQRIKNVCTIYVHTPDGPVTATCKHLAAQDAAEFAYAELERARTARGENPAHQPV